jgi:hypothetical protein
MNGIHEVTGSTPVWSTIFLIRGNSVNAHQLDGSIAPRRVGRKPLIQNDLQFRTKRGSNRRAPSPRTPINMRN